MSEEDTIFGKMVSGKIPCQKVWEDDQAMAFRDISPQAPTHILLIPKQRGGLTRLSNATEDDKAILGHLMWAVGQVTKQEGLTDFRVVINDGERACQSVFHLHLHILGGRQMRWPPG